MECNEQFFHIFIKGISFLGASVVSKFEWNSLAIGITMAAFVKSQEMTEAEVKRKVVEKALGINCK